MLFCCLILFFFLLCICFFQLRLGFDELNGTHVLLCYITGTVYENDSLRVGLITGSRLALTAEGIKR